MFFKDNHKFNNNSIVIFPLENLNSTGNKYLGYSDGYLYFLKSYNIDELYVIKSENNKNISNDIITKAKTKIEENKKTFSVENETYNVVNLFDALYLKDSNISVTLDYIEKQFSVFIEKRIITDELPIEISINKKTDNFKKVYTSLYEDEIYTKGLELKTEINSRKEHILKVLGGTKENWNDYKWQLSNRITNVDTLSKILKLTEREIEQIKEVEENK